MSLNESESTTPVKGKVSKIPIRIGSAMASTKASRIPARFGCESPTKQNITQKHGERFSQMKSPESEGNFGKMTEPHRVATSESLPLSPMKGSEGDQFCSRKIEKRMDIDFSAKDKRKTLNVLLEPRLLEETNSGVQITSPFRTGSDSLSVCPDKSCDEVGNLFEIVEKDEADDVWKPVSEYLQFKSEMRTTEAQTSETSNIDDMECVGSGKYPSIYSNENITSIPSKIKQCSGIHAIKIRHPTPKASVTKMTATLLGNLPMIQTIDVNPEVPVKSMRKDSPQSKLPTEKGDLKRKDTYTVFTEENSKDDMTVNDAGDGDQISAPSEFLNKEEEPPVEIKNTTETQCVNALCVNISKITSSTLRGASRNEMMEPFEVYPQTLLMIPDNVDQPGRYLANFIIANNSQDLTAYKICVNKAANNSLLIQPQFGILPPYSEISINVSSRNTNNDSIGGFSQKHVDGAILEIRSLAVFNVANQRQLFKLWRVAEARFSDSISSVNITKINVLEPRNSRILGAIFDDPEAAADLKAILESKYHSEMLPQMMKNRDFHLNDTQLAILEYRVKKVWLTVKHMDFYFDIGLATTYFLAVYFGVLPYFLSSIGDDNSALKRIPPPDESSIFSKFTRYIYDLVDLI